MRKKKRKGEGRKKKKKGQEVSHHHPIRHPQPQHQPEHKEEEGAKQLQREVQPDQHLRQEMKKILSSSRRGSEGPTMGQWNVGTSGHHGQEKSVAPDGVRSARRTWFFRDWNLWTNYWGGYAHINRACSKLDRGEVLRYTPCSQCATLESQRAG